MGGGQVQIEPIVILTGLAAGAALIAGTVVVYVKKGEMSPASLTLPFIGLVLIGMSVWTEVSFSAGNTSVRLGQDVRDLTSAMRDLGQEIQNVAHDAEQARVSLATAIDELRAIVESSDDDAAAEFATRFAAIEQQVLVVRDLESHTDAITNFNVALDEIAGREAVEVRRPFRFWQD